MRTLSVRPLLLAALILVGGLGACGDENEGGPALGAGGSPGSGGRRGSGGSGGQTTGTGGATGSGGSGGATASGGATGSGGSPEVDATLGTDTTLGTDGAITETAEEAPPAPLCSATSSGIGDDGLIDNFEDTTPEILARDGRMGGWWVSVGPTGMVTGIASAGGPPQNVAGGRTGKALHIVGTETQATSWGASVTATIVADGMTGCYDVTAYKSLKIALKGKVGTKVYVSLLTAPVRATMGMAGNYRREVTLTAAFVEHTIPFVPGFMQGWGAPPPLDLTKVYGVDVSPVITATALDFDFWVDDLAFAK